MKNRIANFYTRRPTPPADGQAGEPPDWLRVEIIHPDGLCVGGHLLVEAGSVVQLRRSAVEGAAAGIYRVLGAC